MYQSLLLPLILVYLLPTAVIGLNSPQIHTLPTLREQAELQTAWREERIENIPKILQKYGVDAWLMSQKEYAEDTVFWSLKKPTQFSARRRTLSLFLASPLPETPSAYTWIDNTPQIWTSLLSVLEKQKPATIAINIDSQIAFASGLHHGEYELVSENLGSNWTSKFVLEPMIAIEYIAHMPSSQFSWYKKLQSTSWSLISTALSNVVIKPGVTRTEDVEWWLRSQLQYHNYTTWFQPDVSVLPFDEFFGDGSKIIEYGDLIHVDFGVTAMGMNTDTQHLGYVLYPGETEADIPKSLKKGLKNANRVQDIVKSNMKIEKSGNDILKTCLAQMEDEGLKGKIYSHPIGDWGHSAGALIGMTNLQEGVDVLGDVPLLENMYFSVELFAETWVEEKNETLEFYLEEDVYWVEGNRWDWVWGRQEEFHLVVNERKQSEPVGQVDL